MPELLLPLEVGSTRINKIERAGILADPGLACQRMQGLLDRAGIEAR